MYRGFYKTRWFIVPVVGLSLTYNIPKFFELKLIFAEEGGFEGMEDQEMVDHPLRNVTVDIAATDMRLNQV